MLPGGLSSREQGGLGSAMLRAAVSLLLRGGCEVLVGVKVLVCHVLSRLLVAGEHHALSYLHASK